MSFAGKKVLITGGGGFLGSHLTDKLLAKDADITIVDIPSKDAERNLAHVRDKVKFVEWDITDFSKSSAIPRDFDYIFHLAAYASPPLCEKNPDKAFRINVQGTYNLLRFASENPSLKKFVFSSSGGIYGTYPKYTPIDEKHPVDISNNVYNVTKMIGEEMCHFFAEKSGLPIVILRLFTTFGPRQTTDYFFPTLISQALKNRKVELWNEKPTRDFNFVDNTVNAFVRAAEVDFVGGPINIGSGREVKIGEIAKKIADSLGSELTFLNKDVVGPMVLCCDNRKAKEVLGWEAKVGLEDGLKITIDWYKENLHLII